MIIELKNRWSRILIKYKWINNVSSLGATPATRLFLYIYGILSLLMYPARIRVSRSSPICFNDRVIPFLFQGLNDYGLFEEILISNAYHLKGNGEHDIKNIIDLGSNSGVSSLYFRSLFPTAIIHSCEPNPLCFHQLKINATNFGNTMPHQILVSDHDGQAEFYIDRKSSVSSSLIKRSSKAVSTTLSCLTLSSFLNINEISHVDILKFDVEGSEELIFTSFTEFNRISTVIGELHYDLCDAQAVCDILMRHYPYSKIDTISNDRAYIIASKQPLNSLM
jgi:FkbM family methyltransferase